MTATAPTTVQAPGVFLPPPPPPPSGNYASAYAYAGLGSRFGAAILDFLVLLAITVVVAIPFGLLAGAFWLTFGTPGLSWFSQVLWGPFTFLLFGLWIVYFSYFESTTGQTPGKRALGLRVISTATARPPDLGHALVRNVLRIVDWLPGLYLVGFVVALVTPQKQRLGDLLADTVVVRS